MPFTPAHVAAALPLRRLKLVWSGLVVGTMAPDFEYFFRMSLDDRSGHTWTGTFLLTLPLALLTLWLFHTFVKLPFVSFLPEGVQRRLLPRLGEFRFRGASRFALIVVSLLVGIATHLTWDSFTHSDTWPYQNWPVLREPMKVMFLGSRPVCRVLQHGSTVLGIGALLIWSVFPKKGTPCQSCGYRFCWRDCPCIRRSWDSGEQFRQETVRRTVYRNLDYLAVVAIRAVWILTSSA